MAIPMSGVSRTIAAIARILRTERLDLVFIFDPAASSPEEGAAPPL
jgi:hypothetical protein